MRSLKEMLLPITKNHALKKTWTMHGDTSQSEGEYNFSCSTIDVTATSVNPILNLDTVFAKTVEICDLMRVPKPGEPLYLYHVKAGLSRDTRVVCAQVRASMVIINEALQTLSAEIKKFEKTTKTEAAFLEKMGKSKNHLVKYFYDLVTYKPKPLTKGESETDKRKFRIQIREKMKSDIRTLYGYNPVEFLKLFTQEIIFVIALANTSKTPLDLKDEANHEEDYKSKITSVAAQLALSTIRKEAQTLGFEVQLQQIRSKHPNTGVSFPPDVYTPQERQLPAARGAGAAGSVEPESITDVSILDSFKYTGKIKSSGNTSFLNAAIQAIRSTMSKNKTKKDKKIVTLNSNAIDLFQLRPGQQGDACVAIRTIFNTHTFKNFTLLKPIEPGAKPKPSEGFRASENTYVIVNVLRFTNDYKSKTDHQIEPITLDGQQYLPHALIMHIGESIASGRYIAVLPRGQKQATVYDVNLVNTKKSLPKRLSYANSSASKNCTTIVYGRQMPTTATKVEKKATKVEKKAAEVEKKAAEVTVTRKPIPAAPAAVVFPRTSILDSLKYTGGIRNSGNTCFINAAIQALRSTILITNPNNKIIKLDSKTLLGLQPKPNIQGDASEAMRRIIESNRRENLTVSQTITPGANPTFLKELDIEKNEFVIVDISRNVDGYKTTEDHPIGPIEFKGQRYLPHALIMHIGAHITSGHYIAVVADGDENVKVYNDALVSSVETTLSAYSFDDHAATENCTTIVYKKVTTDKAPDEAESASEVGGAAAASSLLGGVKREREGSQLHSQSSKKRVTTEQTTDAAESLTRSAASGAGGPAVAFKVGGVKRERGESLLEEKAPKTSRIE